MPPSGGMPYGWATPAKPPVLEPPVLVPAEPPVRLPPEPVPPAFVPPALVPPGFVPPAFVPPAFVPPSPGPPPSPFSSLWPPHAASAGAPSSVAPKANVAARPRRVVGRTGGGVFASDRAALQNGHAVSLTRT